MTTAIRIRRCVRRGFVRRRRYEVEFVNEAGRIERREETTLPVTIMDPFIGVAESWSLVHAADKAWKHTPGAWLQFPPAAQTAMQ